MQSLWRFLTVWGSFIALGFLVAFLAPSARTIALSLVLVLVALLPVVLCSVIKPVWLMNVLVWLGFMLFSGIYTCCKPLTESGPLIVTITKGNLIFSVVAGTVVFAIWKYALWRASVPPKAKPAGA